MAVGGAKGAQTDLSLPPSQGRLGAKTTQVRPKRPRCLGSQAPLLWPLPHSAPQGPQLSGSLPFSMTLNTKGLLDSPPAGPVYGLLGPLQSPPDPLLSWRTWASR